MGEEKICMYCPLGKGYVPVEENCVKLHIVEDSLYELEICDNAFVPNNFKHLYDMGCMLRKTGVMKK